jgi:hypothetical protein
MLRGKDMKKNWNHDPKLVGGFKHDFYFPLHIWDVILPIDSYFSRWLNPPTSKFLGLGNFRDVFQTVQRCPAVKIMVRFVKIWVVAMHRLAFRKVV